MESDHCGDCGRYHDPLDCPERPPSCQDCGRYHHAGECPHRTPPEEAEALNVLKDALGEG
jgi:hypothetical protein